MKFKTKLPAVTISLALLVASFLSIASQKVEVYAADVEPNQVVEILENKKSEEISVNEELKIEDLKKSHAAEIEKLKAAVEAEKLKSPVRNIRRYVYGVAENMMIGLILLYTKSTLGPAWFFTWAFIDMLILPMPAI